MRGTLVRWMIGVAALCGVALGIGLLYLRAVEELPLSRADETLASPAPRWTRTASELTAARAGSSVDYGAVAALDQLVAAGLGAAQLAFVDPDTGELLAQPADGGATSAAMLVGDLMRSDEGLTEIALPGGGAMVDLEGRFITSLVVTVPAELRQRAQGEEETTSGADASEKSDS